MDDIDWGWKWRNAVTDAVAWQQYGQLHSLAVQALKRAPCKEALRQLGIGILLNDSHLWSLSPNKDTGGVARDALQKWRTHAASTSAREVKRCSAGTDDAPSKTIAPLSGLKCASFLEHVERMEVWTSSVDTPPAPAKTCKTVAIAVVLRGFYDWRHLDGLWPTDTEQWCSSPDATALLARCVKAATLGAAKELASRCVAVQHLAQCGKIVGPTTELASERSSIGAASSLVLAEHLTPEGLESRETALQKSLESKQLTGLGVSLGPQQAIQALSAAKKRGLEVDDVLCGMADNVLIETNRKSLPSVASGLRAWHSFATEVLSYPEEATLPPRHDGDVVKFICIFRSGGTAANYVSYMSWGCRKLRIQRDWYSETVTAALAGLKKKGLRLTAGCLVKRFVLHDNLVWRMQRLGYSIGEADKGDIFAILFQFLLRVQSEGCHVHAGSAEFAVSLPVGIVAALWVEPSKQRVFLRLRSRKNKPGGSLLSRSCTCSDKKQPCAYHAAENLTKHVKPGELLWDVQPYALLRDVKRFLVLLHVQTASAVTLKSFRAGKACSLAASGSTIQQILEHGEWRSKAVLNYLSSEAIDEIAMLNASLVESEDEATEQQAIGDQCIAESSQDSKRMRIEDLPVL